MKKSKFDKKLDKALPLNRTIAIGIVTGLTGAFAIPGFKGPILGFILLLTHIVIVALTERK